MFVQIHMLQSMPPGNLNRDDSGQPKKCMFGGVTRGRISSQCLKRNIRLSEQFNTSFGDNLSDRTKYLPKMINEQLENEHGFADKAELEKVEKVIVSNFSSDGGTKGEGQTPQLVFFPPSFAVDLANIISKLKSDDKPAYDKWLKGKDKKLDAEIFEKSKAFTIDIALFGRMTTSDLVINVEAACQVAHAISTHETVIESDYFTAMDDKKIHYAESQTDALGAAHLGSGDSSTFFNASVYYKYLNVDVSAVMKHLEWDTEQAADAIGTLIEASVFSNPTGKQNSFAAHGMPELVLVEVSNTKRPISYANAFLEAVKGSNYMSNSATALQAHIGSVAKAYAPKDTQRFLLAIGSAAAFELDGATRTEDVDSLVGAVSKTLKQQEVTA